MPTPHIPQLLGGFAIRGISDLPPLIRNYPYKTSPYSSGLFFTGKHMYILVDIKNKDKEEVHTKEGVFIKVKEHEYR